VFDAGPLCLFRPLFLLDNFGEEGLWYLVSGPQPADIFIIGGKMIVSCCTYQLKIFFIFGEQLTDCPLVAGLPRSKHLPE